MKDPCPKDRPQPGPNGCGASASARGEHRGSHGRAVGRMRRTVVCDGVQGVFAPGADGVWRLANTAELAVLEGLGGSADGIGRLRGMDEALALQVAGPGDLADLARCLRTLADACEVFEAGAPAELTAAVAAACLVWADPNAAGWLCWALASRLAPWLSDASSAGPGWQGWEAHLSWRYARIDWPNSRPDGGPGGGLWARAASHPDPTVRACAQASDPAAGRRTLRRLADLSQPAEVLDAVASHPRTPGRALLRVCTTGWMQHLWRTAQNTAAPARVLRRAAKSAESRWLVAQNPSAGRRTLAVLACDDDVSVLSWVAVHPRPGRRALRRLAADEVWWVREHAAAHPAVPRRIVKRLATDRHRKVRAAAAASPRLPRRRLARAARDHSLVVRAAAAGADRLSGPLAARLASDGHWKVRERAAAREGGSDRMWAAVAADPHPRVRRATASNASCPPGILVGLAAGGDRLTRAAAASNPSTPPEAVAALASDKDARVRRNAASNPSCPAEALVRLASDRGVAARLAVALSPAGPPEALAVLAGDRNAWIRRAAAENPSCPPEALAVLAGDDSRDASC